MNINKYKIVRTILLGIVLFIIGFNLSNLSLNLDQNSPSISETYIINSNNIHTSTVESYTKQWLKNSDFSSQELWNSEMVGDSRDVIAYIGEEHGNYQIIGDSGALSIDAPLSDTDWTVFNNPNLPILPDVYEINSSGCYVSHLWHEDINQTRNRPSIYWKRTITMPVNMTDYIITSASLEVIFNATVTVSPHGEPTGGEGIDRLGDANLDDYSTGDYAKFYVLLSDIEETFPPIEIAHNNTALGDLGQDGPPYHSYAVSNFPDTAMKKVPENILSSVLTSVLGTNGYNFTITLGIDIYCEDNEIGVDIDRWNSLIIRSFNLTFTYVKRIDKLTAISWSQTGNAVQGKNTQITDASLNFTYSVNQTWPEDLAPNTEMRILINDNDYKPAIKLSSFNTTFREKRINGTDFTSLFQRKVNITLSLQLFLLDTFALDHNLTISIDDVYLKITYIVVTLEFYQEPWFFALLLIIASIIGACIGGYLVAYYKVLRYPRPVRKVRKYRKTLRRTNAPSTPIVGSEKAFKGAYIRELAAVAAIAKVSPAVQKAIPGKATEPKQTPSAEIKTKTLEDKIEQDKLIEKSLEKKEELDKLVEKAKK